MRNPGQSQVWTSAVKKTISRLSPVLNCCLLGVVIFLVVTMLGLKLSFSQLEEKTAAKLSGIKLSVSQLTSEHLKLESSVENLQGNSDGLFAGLKPFKKWRGDFKCGPGFLTEDGYPAECNPDSSHPCCSRHNWCDKTTEHCDCRGCIDYRKRQ
ncbi:PREDICTED: uncharacterized protein LOC109465540 [Branchiostoma belcheri]|uniref:Uncharacterized protein LOC109465540 n=1 Tax=Branchiostoma belcheri TaxID=7741 RepID=A0A6P4YI70_BRABE|nr:PREDICTED: uncharacterized protein LOC109465540 [Branchiostoma belcheri]